MSTEESFSPQSSLLLIENMIKTAKNRFSENGHLYLIWGWTIFFCSLFHFVTLKFHLIKHPEAVWILTWLAVIYQFIYLARQKKKERVKSYTDEIESYVWITFVILMGLSCFLMSYKHSWETMYPMFLVLYGMPTFLSGIVLRFKPLKLGGVCCWALALIAIFIDFEYQLLLLALAVLAAWIVPGYLLRSKFKLQQ